MDQATTLQTVGTGRFAILERDGGPSPYTVSSLVPILRERPGRPQRVGAPAGVDDLSRRHQEAVSRAWRRTCSGRRRSSSKRRSCRMAASDNPYDIADAAVKELQSSDFQYDDGHPRREVRIAQHGRVLRDVQEGVLPVLRGDDGGDPAQPRHPDAHRRRVPAGHDGQHPIRPSGSSSTTPTPGSRSTSRTTAG